MVLSVDEYHQVHADAVIMALSTKAGGRFGDCPIDDWKEAGLPGATYAKAVLQTILRNMIDRRYGTLTPADFARVKASVRAILGL